MARSTSMPLHTRLTISPACHVAGRDFDDPEHVLLRALNDFEAVDLLLGEPLVDLHVAGECGVAHAGHWLGPLAGGLVASRLLLGHSAARRGLDLDRNLLARG